ncbi:hypothetical protein [Thalassotalea sediminis]|uniref:hypothetical protein n=1 Tax=Thalassotalea sediminis TaxID=1759089 RepID=UPI002573B565|nr:hypothetical protein [Thalassotalea sediminis]
MRHLSFGIVLYFISQITFAATECRTYSTGEDGYQSSIYACFWKPDPGQNSLGGSDTSVADYLNGQIGAKLPTQQQLENQIQDAEDNFKKCINSANNGIPTCYKDRIDETYALWVGCVTLFTAGTSGPPSPLTIVGTLGVAGCDKTANYEYQRSEKVCKDQAAKKKEQCTFEV